MSCEVHFWLKRTPPLLTRPLAGKPFYAPRSFINNSSTLLTTPPLNEGRSRPIRRPTTNPNLSDVWQPPIKIKDDYTRLQRIHDRPQVLMFRHFFYFAFKHVSYLWWKNIFKWKCDDDDGFRDWMQHIEINTYIMVSFDFSQRWYHNKRCQ